MDTSSSAHGAAAAASLSSSRSSNRWKYEVFLSFRGEDTRKTFTSHLFIALRDAGINTFIDNQLRRGENIQSELDQEIEGSRIAVIVFSKRYAESRWCLRELSKIMRCLKDQEGKIVCPIFYDVDPSQVRKQEDSFEEAFQKHEKDEDRNEVKQWREDLKASADLGGWNLKTTADGCEGVFIEKIVGDVNGLLKTRDFKEDKHSVGMAFRVQEFSTEYLDVGGLPDVRIIGIYGMGGIGKTTLAKAVCSNYEQSFSCQCYLEDVRSKKKEMVSLQEQLLRDILKQPNIKVSSVAEGTKEIKKRLRSMKVLVVVDDIDDADQLDELAIEHESFGLGSRIIITTRDEHVLNIQMVDKKYKAQAMKEKEALKLLSCHAFGNDYPDKEYIELARDIVDYCGGLPLALKVVGRLLATKKSKTIWVSTLDKLRNIPDGKIHETLKLSYNGLHDDHVKGVFLNISCFFIGEHISLVTAILDVCSPFSVEVEITTLCDRCLLYVDEKEKLRMHDLIRDMGREIVRAKSPMELGKRSLLWHNKDAKSVLRNELGTEAVEGLRLYSDDEQSFSTEAFKKMWRLKFLHLKNVKLTGSYKHLSKELRWLLWIGFPLEAIPACFDQRNLVCLDLRYSKIVRVWEDSDSDLLPEKLKYLVLGDCHNLTELPDFSKLPHLKELDVSGCKGLCGGYHFLAQLKMIEELDLSDCNITDGAVLEIIGSLSSLTTLYLGGNGFNRLPILSGLSQLQFLNLNRCTNLQAIPDLPNSLNTLLAADCTALEILPDFSEMSKMTWLGLINCDKLKDIPKLKNLYDGVILSGNDFPNRFAYVAIEDETVKFQVPPSIDDIGGLAFGIVVSSDISDSIGCLYFDVINHTQRTYFRTRYHSILTRSHEYYIWLGNLPNKKLNLKSGDMVFVKAEFYGGDNRIKVYKTGVDIVKWHLSDAHTNWDAYMTMPYKFNEDTDNGTRLSFCNVFLCYKTPEAWPWRIEGFESDPLPKFFTSALEARKKDITVKTLLTLIEGCEGTESSDGDALIFPQMIKYRGLKESDVDSFVDDVLVNHKPWASRVPELLTGSHVFVCAHCNRDERNRDSARVLIDKFKEEAELQGLTNQVFVTACYYTGGHNGNLIIYCPGSYGSITGHWYGYVTPYDVPELLDKHIQKGEIIERLWRGQMGASSDEAEKINDQKLPNGGEIHEKLKLLYDGLRDDHVKGVFLDISNFFIGWDSRAVTAILDDCSGLSVKAEMTTLCDRGLLYIEEQKLRMHDLSRDMGRKIVREESPVECGKRSRLWHSEDAKSVLRNESGTEAVEGLKLVLPEHFDDEQSFSTEAFKKMRRLKFLMLQNVKLTGSYKHLSKELRLLSWNGFPLEAIPADFDQRNLVYLNLWNSKIVRVWEDSDLLPTKLKFLRLRHCHNLTELPDFSKHPHLEVLSLRSCKGLCGGYHFLAQLKMIEQLNLSDCNITDGAVLEIIGSLSSLLHLVLGGNGFNRLPILSGLSQLQGLYLNHCTNLQAIPDLPNSLIKLEANYCTALEIMSDFSKHPHLKILNLSGCKGLCEGYHFLAQLKMIEKLNLSDCNITDDAVLEIIGSLSFLTSLSLGENGFNRLPILSGLSQLRFLYLNRCTNLQAIPDLPNSLIELEANYCTALEIMSDFSEMSKMRKLQLKDCRKLNDIPNLENSMDYMDSIHMEGCTSLTDTFKGNLQTKNAFGGIFLSGNDIPHWLAYVAREDETIKFEVPPSIDYIGGLALGIVYSSDNSDSTGSLCIDVVNCTQRTNFCIQPMGANVIASHEYYLWLGNLSNKKLNLKGGDKVIVKAEFWGQDNKIKVKKTGVDIVKWDLSHRGTNWDDYETQSYESDEDTEDDTQLSNRHIFLCYKTPEAWPWRIEGFESDPLPKFFASALKARKNDITVKTLLTVIEGCEGTESSDGDALIFPQMIKYRGLKESDVDSFVDDVLVNHKPWASRVPELLTGSHVFVCAHCNRDERNRDSARVLIDKFKEEAELQGLTNQVFVTACYYTGGHNGNLIIYCPGSYGSITGHWYGYVTPYDVPELLDKHIQKGEIIERLWRGQMGASSDEAEKINDQKLPNGGEIHEKLKLLYDGLRDDHVKGVFLDISNFFIGWDSTMVTAILDACSGLSVKADMTTLCDRGLLYIEEQKLRMHDLSRDMGRKIVREESPVECGKRSRLWHSEDAKSVLRNESGTEAVEGLELYLPEDSDDMQSFSTEGFKKMWRLKFLHLENVKLTGSYKHLSKELRSLVWTGFPLEAMPADFDQRNLVYMDLWNSKIVRVWEDSDLLPEKLKYLCLGGCHNLTELPDFSKLPHLEVLNVRGCKGLCGGYHFLAQLKMIDVLDLSDCNITDGAVLEIIGSLSSLLHLVLGGNGFNRLPILSGLSQLQGLYLNHCTNLQAIPDLPNSLIKLEANYCTALEIMSDFSKHPHLKILNLSGCKGLCEGYHFLAQLKMIEKLNLSDCNITDDAVLEIIGSLSFLTSLSLGENGFNRLPILSGLSQLRFLYLNRCTNLQAIPDLPNSLIELEANYCTALEIMSDFSEMSKMRKLQLKDCRKLNDIPNLENSMDYMDSIHMEGCTSLTDTFKGNLQTKNAFGGIFLSGNDIPHWLAYVAREDETIKFEVPPSIDYIGGLALGIVYSSDNSDSTGSLCIDVVNCTQRTNFCIQPMGANVIASHEYYLWLGNLSNKKLNLKGGDKVIVKAEFWGQDNKIKVKKTGVDIVKWDLSHRGTNWDDYETQSYESDEDTNESYIMSYESDEDTDDDPLHKLSNRHIFLCYKTPEAWPWHIEGFESDPLPKFFASALKAHDSTVKTLLTVIEGREGTEFSDGDVLIFPQMIKYRGLKESDVDSFVDDVLVNHKPWASGVQEPWTSRHLFICAHMTRNEWNRDPALVLVDKFKEEAELRGLTNHIFVTACLHIEDHKYARNLTIYRKDSIHRYRYVTPDDVPELLDEHIGKGEMIERPWRGQIGTSSDKAEKSNDQQLPNGGENEKIEKPQENGNQRGSEEKQLKETTESCAKKDALGKLSSLIGNWEQSDVLTAAAVVGAMATVVVAYSFYRRSS